MGIGVGHSDLHRATDARSLAFQLEVPFRVEGLVPAPGVSFAQAIASGIAPLDEAACGFRFALSPMTSGLKTLADHDLRGRTDIAIMPTDAFRDMLRRHARPQLLDYALNCVERVKPGQTAKYGMSAAQQRWLFATLIMAAAVLLISLEVGMLLLSIATIPIFFGLVLLRVSAVIDAFAPARASPSRLSDRQLPIYTVLVPLYREAAVVDQLRKALLALEYPPDRLDIKIIVEEGDTETLVAIKQGALPPHMEVLVAPAGWPQTKPRALNIGLREARGELITIYDAEDRPDPRQLRLAANLFHRLPSDVGCLQGRLVIDNADDSILTRLFALEYAGLFDVLNAGLIKAGLPVLLGGTSNHFKTGILRKIGGWDAWNVTEDADLSFRLARNRYRILDLPSDTLEEAPATLRLWFAQRVRWIKGFVQTSVTHSRQPRQFFRDVGMIEGLTLMSLCGGTILSILGYPAFLAASMITLVLSGIPQPDTLGTWLLLTLWLSLMVIGLLAMFAPLILGARHRGLTDLLIWLPLMPLYYLLVSAAGWVALAEYARAPTQWNKTEHGLAKTSRTLRRKRDLGALQPAQPKRA